MGTVRKVLGQSTGVADTVVYTSPANTDTVISSIVICETNGVAATVRITIDPAGGTATAAGKSVAWDLAIGANQTVALALGITLEAGGKVVMKASTANVTVNLFGQQNS